MVFRGKPSRACERCRARRLRCDLHSGACSQCVRARELCSGYRDTRQLRIRNESESVVRKALENAPSFEPRSLSLSMDSQARDAFFARYVTSTSKCWEFLKPYYHPTDSPDHLTLAIEAVSLAYLWQIVYSDATLAAARKRYISALQITSKCLKCSEEATKDTILLASLLLDVFEKITGSKFRTSKSWTSHVNGALALVRLRGLEQFQEPSEFRILRCLCSHYVISCVARSSPVPIAINAVRAYIGKHQNFQDPLWRLLHLMVNYAKLRSEIRRENLSSDEYIALFAGLDLKLQTLELDTTPSWQYSTTTLEHKSERSFDLYFDSYSDRSVSYAWNVLRLVRIHLNESLIERYLALPADDKSLVLIEAAHANIKKMAGEICATVPQYVDCDGAARERLPPSEKAAPSGHNLDPILDRGSRGAGHPHTPTHQVDCYTLIFPLYVAGRSEALPDIRSWVTKQLHYISSHFYVRNAEVVAQILERETDVSPWEVYAMLGSYAFAA